MIDILHRVKNEVKSIHWVLLVFLIGILNPSLTIKLASLFLVFLIQPSFNLLFKKNRLPIFYGAIIFLIIIQSVFNYSLWSKSYLIVVCLGLVFWIISFLVIHQLKVFAEKLTYKQLDKTIMLFFLINACVSFYQLIGVMIESEAINPYGFTGIYYSATVGDWIKGVIGDSSIVNASICLLGFIYFFHQRKYWMTILCLLTMLIATSNIVSMLLLLYLIITIVISIRDKVRVVMAFFFLTITITFYTKISYSNSSVIVEQITGGKKNILREEYVKMADKRKEKAEKEELINTYLSQIQQKDTVNAITSLSDVKQDTSANNLITSEEQEIQDESKVITSEQIYLTEIEKQQQRYKQYIQKHYGIDTLVSSNLYGIPEYPGKLVSILETLKFSASNVKNFIFGTGPGGFSSSLAFKVSELNYGGESKIGKLVKYRSQNFTENHLRVQCYYLQQFNSEHSIINFPYSSFNQVLGEYGWIGVFLFVVYYLWFFLKRFKYLTYGRELLFVLVALLFVDYWFEALSLVVFFELLMFIDLKSKEVVIKSNDDSGQIESNVNNN